jgi:hypothetical protein
MQLKKFDALAALLAAATGLALAEDRSRTEIVPSPGAPAVEATAVGAMTGETCAQAEYRGRALRVSVILTGGMPDADWRGQARPAPCVDAAPVEPAPLRRTDAPDLTP